MALTQLECRKLDVLKRRFGGGHLCADEALKMALEAEQTCKDLGPLDPAFFKNQQQDLENMALLIEKGTPEMVASVDVDALRDLGYSVDLAATPNDGYRWWRAARSDTGRLSNLEVGDVTFLSKADAWAAAKAHSELVLGRDGEVLSAAT